MSRLAVQRVSTSGALTQDLCSYINELYDRIAKRAFSFFDRDGQIHGRDVNHWLTAEAEVLNPVPLELSETDTELTVRAEVPGFNEKELEIIVEPIRLFIKGKVDKKIEEQKKKTLYCEIASNEIFRSVSLPAEIDPEKVSAVLNNGVVEISMQKASPAKTINIAGKAA
jgi:HSP20 family protein